MEVTDEHFRVVENRVDAPRLIFAAKGPTMVMFYLPHCAACSKLKPELQHYARQESHVRFFFANIHQYPNITRMSASTKTRIQKAPYFIFFHEGQPIAHHVGKNAPDMDAVIQLMNQGLSKIQNNMPSSIMEPTTSMTRGANTEELYRNTKESGFATPVGITPYTDPWKGQTSFPPKN